MKLFTPEEAYKINTKALHTKIKTTGLLEKKLIDEKESLKRSIDRIEKQREYLNSTFIEVVAENNKKRLEIEGEIDYLKAERDRIMPELEDKKKKLADKEKFLINFKNQNNEKEKGLQEIEKKLAEVEAKNNVILAKIKEENDKLESKKEQLLIKERDLNNKLKFLKFEETRIEELQVNLAKDRIDASKKFQEIEARERALVVNQEELNKNILKLDKERKHLESRIALFKRQTNAKINQSMRRS